MAYKLSKQNRVGSNNNLLYYLHTEYPLPNNFILFTFL